MRVYNIDWDADEEVKKDLPTEMEVPERESIYIEDIENYLSEQTGFCVHSFSF